MPIEILGLIGDYADLQYYAESFTETLLQAESTKIAVEEVKEEESDEEVFVEEGDNDKEDEDYEGKDKVDDYWIISSNLYKKRENLSGD